MRGTEAQRGSIGRGDGGLGQGRADMMGLRSYFLGILGGGGGDWGRV